MKLNLNRRDVLRSMGIQLALPLLSTVIPTETKAQAMTPPRKRFIGAYVPNGAYMPAGDDGNWNFTEALQPLVAAQMSQHTMICRGLFNGHGADPHWENTASFLSCRPIQLGDPGIAACGKTVDQFVADKYVSPLRSIEIGGLYYYIHPLNDHPAYSNDYLNRISWQAPDKFRSPIADPARLFEKLFAVDSSGAAAIAFTHARKKSVLDAMHKDASRMATRLPTEYRPVLTAYMETVREVELQIAAPTRPACVPTFGSPNQDFSTPDRNYVVRFQLMHQMLVLGMQCGLSNVGTIMYGPGVSDQLTFVESLGAGIQHHAAAHHAGDVGAIARLKNINRIQAGLLADLLTKLKAVNLLSDTLVVYGSDMSDGNVHLGENLPMLLCGAGSDLKFGQVVGSKAVKKPLSDLHMEIFSLMGVSSVTSFGSGRCVSTQTPLPIRT